MSGLCKLPIGKNPGFFTVQFLASGHSTQHAWNTRVASHLAGGEKRPSPVAQLRLLSPVLRQRHRPAGQLLADFATSRGAATPWRTCGGMESTRQRSSGAPRVAEIGAPLLLFSSDSEAPQFRSVEVNRAVVPMRMTRPDDLTARY